MAVPVAAAVLAGCNPLTTPPDPEFTPAVVSVSSGVVDWVVDGDTVRMHCPVQGFVSGRLVGFDTPEMNARCPRELGMAVAATYYLRWQLWTAREVVATPRDRDRYDRVLTLMGFDGDLASTRMIRSGLARPYDGGQRRSWCDA